MNRILDVKDRTSRTFDGSVDRKNRNFDGGVHRTNRKLDIKDRTNRKLYGKDITNETLDGEDRTWIEEELNNWEREEAAGGYKRLPIMDSNQQGQSAINQEQQEKMHRMVESMREMKEMMAMFLQQNQSPRSKQLPETPAQQQGPSLRFATSTPQTGRTVGLDTTIRGIEDSLMDTPVPTPESSQFKQKKEIKLPDERKGIRLDTRKVNLHFDGSEVKIFIKRVEKVASMHGAGARNWELLKKELIHKWGRATPLRRYDENSIPNFISKYTEKGGIQTEDYRAFINVTGHGEGIGTQQEVTADEGWKGSDTQAGKLKEYMEASLSILALGESTGKLTQLQEIKKLRTELNTSQNSRALPPHFALPRNLALGLRPIGTGTYQRPHIQCYYVKNAAHTVIFCPHLTADLEKKLLFKQGPNYYYPNREPIPTDASESI
ncbi:hypothetical protein VP01_5222g1 [Puccinia sorghi]|uniref:Uncharacterized protein n=1 Tax=Puccinia sorghi TaxID=27349 RepID=A0A0L6UKM3_9BASI|nr:hypothetical protein VP01_5222g1 [Puccinia sorghi]